VFGNNVNFLYFFFLKKTRSKGKKKIKTFFPIPDIVFFLKSNSNETDKRLTHMEKLINNSIIPKNKQGKKEENVFAIYSKDVHPPFSLNTTEISFGGQSLGRVLKQEKISNKQGTIYTIEFYVALEYDPIFKTISYKGNFISHTNEEHQNTNRNYSQKEKKIPKKEIERVTSPKDGLNPSKTLCYAIMSILYDFDEKELLNVLAHVTKLKENRNH
jgi:hypothetical protein